MDVINCQSVLCSLLFLVLGAMHIFAHRFKLSVREMQKRDRAELSLAGHTHTRKRKEMRGKEGRCALHWV